MRQLTGVAAMDGHEHARLTRLTDAMRANVDGVLLLRTLCTDAGAIEDFEVMEANTSGAALLRRSVQTVTGLRLCRDLPKALSAALVERYADAIALQTPIVEEVRVNRRHLAAGWLFHQVTPTSDGVAVTLRDISVRKRDEAILRRVSLTDELTRLYNRRGFHALAEQHLRIARRQEKDAVLLYVDMDNFKQLNDVYGHDTGDRALTAIARLLRSTVRDCDIVGRMGGDEFTILALDADGGGARAMQRRIDEHLLLLNASGVFPVPLAFTMGFTRIHPNEDAPLTEFFARADRLLYLRKRRRKQSTASSAESAAMATSRPRRMPRIASAPILAEVAALARAAASILPGAAVGATQQAAGRAPASTFFPTQAA